MPEDLCAQHIPYPMHTIAYAKDIASFSAENQIWLKGLGCFIPLLVLPIVWMRLSRNNSLQLISSTESNTAMLDNLWMQLLYRSFTSPVCISHASLLGYKTERVSLHSWEILGLIQCPPWLHSGQKPWCEVNKKQTFGKSMLSFPVGWVGFRGTTC